MADISHYIVPIQKRIVLYCKAPVSFLLTYMIYFTRHPIVRYNMLNTIHI